MYVIVNTKTGKFVYGTDYRYNPPRQKTSNSMATTYDCLLRAKADFAARKCGKGYKIAVIEPIKVKEFVELLDKKSATREMWGR